ncbi:MAG: DUF1289 domain-containing protein, partial [Spiribacter sp.]|nr:DUF1289 domain-containing protein [Spiribacter sp.]
CGTSNGRASYWSLVMIESPCVGVCRVDSDFVCIGCGRHIEDIMYWPEMTEDERQAALDRAFGRV